jgi:hypothetical protein
LSSKTLNKLPLEAMLKYKKIKSNETQFLSLTSLYVNEFEALLVDFHAVWDSQMRYFTFGGKERLRKYSEKKNGLLPDTADKLFFILYYLKNQPLQEALAASFGMTQPQANTYIHKYRQVLHKALDMQGCLPARSADSLKKRLVHSDESDFYTDAVERAIPRSTDWETQKENYSGKKKMHTQKNTVFSGSDSKIYYLSDSYEGKTHDKKINEIEQVELPENSRCFQDTGFLGYSPEGENIEIVMPTKKPKGKELTKDQKEENTRIARVRVKVEHVMSGIKRLRVIKDKIRVFANNFRDQAMEIACALHNFRLIFRPWEYPSADKILQR